MGKMWAIWISKTLDYTLAVKGQMHGWESAEKTTGSHLSPPHLHLDSVRHARHAWPTHVKIDLPSTLEAFGSFVCGELHTVLCTALQVGT